MLFDNVVEAIGHTPVVRLRLEDSPQVEAYAKLELQNLYGMKDRVARSILLEAKRLGALTEGAPIIESSSGTMALGVALVGTALGHPVHIVTDPRIDRITLAKLRALGCEVHVVEAMTRGGWQSARLERLAELRAGLPGAFWPDQYDNPDNPAGYRALATELIEDLGAFDILVGSVGSGGSLCGSARALRAELPHLRVVGADSTGSVLFGQPDRPGRLQSGLGNSLHPKNLDRSLIDEVHWLNDREAFQATRDLVSEQGLFAGNTSGSVYQVLKFLARRAPAGTRIVGILPDRGDRYTDTVYDDGYWSEHDLAALDLATVPEATAPGQVVQGWSRTSGPMAESAEKRRRLLFVESNTTGSGMLALSVAHELGFSPVLLTAAPERYVGLDDTECEVLPCDTGSPLALRLAVRDAFRREELAGVTTTSEFYAEAVADLARWLGLPGNAPDAVAACRNKAVLRRRLDEAGVPQPRHAAVTDIAQLAAARDKIGLPCVVKPVDDTGSHDVLLCRTEDELTAHVRHVLDARLNVRGLPTARTGLVEQYLEGPEYSVETFSAQGRVHCVGITEKRVGGLPHFVECGHVFPAQLSAPVAAAIEATVRQAIAAVGLGHGAAHTEIRLTERGPAVIEINPRPAGGMITEAIRLATGVELLEQQLRAATGLPQRTDAEAVRCAAIRFLLAPRAGRLVEVRGVAEASVVEGVAQVTVTASPGTTVRPAQDAYDRLGYVIAHGDSYEEATKVCDEAHSRIELVVADDPRPGDALS
ncbi:pyridoxal-phosphate dependent enzyme [Streptomyces sp. NPDC096132]|uniref:pyridoxal-phosphate dependent enzyme n=1 Tax=Streptomyces sp. NPDC096132 TaxID=3366075 RepID=UPI00381D8166